MQIKITVTLTNVTNVVCVENLKCELLLAFKIQLKLSK